MLTILIILSLGGAFYRGYRQGMMRQVVKFIRFVLSFVVAVTFVGPLADVLEFYVPFPSVVQTSQLAIYDEATSFLLDQAFYRVLSFIVISSIIWIITKFITVFTTKLRQNIVTVQTDKMIGGIVNLLLVYIVMYILLFTLSLLPIEWIQQQFVNNRIAYWIVSQTPGLSQLADKLWLHVSSI